jgi:hypothetical protein
LADTKLSVTDQLTIQVLPVQHEGGNGYSKRTGIKEDAEIAMEAVSDALASVARGSVAAFSRLSGSVAPDELTIEFGVALSHTAGILLVGGTQQVHFKCTATWKKGGTGPPSHEE